tara:strand:- start:2001 stop:2909 length:909 start_codon:yes stop_codon:yes gene_type:complete
MINVLITTSTFNKDILKKLSIKNNFKIIMNKTGKKVDYNFLKKKISRINVIIAGTEVYDEKVLKLASDLKAIYRIGVGTDNINLDFCKKNNIKIFTSKTDLSTGVAEHAIGLIFSAIKKITEFDKNIKTKKWKKRTTKLLSNKKIGIIGLGKIGKKIYKLLKPFKLKYFYNDKKRYNYSNIKFKSIKELFKICDVITIHLPLNKKTNKIINKKIFIQSNPNIILINTSRGEVINETDLANFLFKNKKAFAALDVFQKEPYFGKLQKLQNIILTPHVGGYSQELRSQMENEAIDKIIQKFSEK